MMPFKDPKKMADYMRKKRAESRKVNMDNKYRFLIRVLSAAFVLDLLNLTIWSNLNIIYLVLSDILMAFAVIFLVDILIEVYNRYLKFYFKN